MKKTQIFKKIRKLVKKPLERTIYHNETKKFIPRKHHESFDDMLELRHSLTGGNCMNFTETQKKTPTKRVMQDEEIEGILLFGIPETPKPCVKKMRGKVTSMDIFRIGKIRN